MRRVHGARLTHGHARLLALRPHARIESSQRHIDNLDTRLRRATGAALDIANHRLVRAEGLLASLSPRGVLERGYAIVRDADGRVLRDADNVATGSAIDILLARAHLHGTVTGID